MKDFQQYWQRVEFDGMPVYFYKHSADWFVPNKQADKILQEPQESLAYQKLLHRISLPNPKVYTKQSTQTPKALKEFWLHVTNRCNIECQHCLFSSSVHEKDTLSLEVMKKHIKEAYELGCRLFVLSGGEPFVRADINELLAFIFALEKTKVVILTNGMLLEKKLEKTNFDKTRLSLQISLDGLPKEHDAVRGEGSFEKLEQNLVWLKKRGLSFFYLYLYYRAYIEAFR